MNYSVLLLCLQVLNSLQPHEGFRLWLTAETHPKFPTILLQSSLKVTLEAPPGIKKNMLRSYDSWNANFVQQGNGVARPQTLFALAWLHALVEERRNYIPQVRKIGVLVADLLEGLILVS